jgi:filamentous hemagglutinin family protein
MTKTYFWLYFLTLSGLIFSTRNAIAQDYQPSNRPPVADNTQIGTQVSSGDGKNFDIKGGTTQGQTLFHSFQDFSVPTNGAANFANQAGIRDMISRVTGGSFSDINGRINSNGANFFLINPNGIVFGPNAQLNVGRAFMASTANGINLVDGGGKTITFGTNPNGGEPLLTINPNVFFNVSSLTMGGGSGQISNFGKLQNNNPNPYIGLIGGNVTLDGGEISVPGGRVELGGLSALGTVNLGVDVNNLRAQFPTNVARGDVSLTNRAEVNTYSYSAVDTGVMGNGGNIDINAGSLSLKDGGQISASTFGIENAGSIVVGNGGNIDINAGSLSLKDGGQISASTSGIGNAGSINVKVAGAVDISGEKDGFRSGIFSGVLSDAKGNGGNIDITAGSLSLKDGGRILTSISKDFLGNQPAGQGDAGNIKVLVTGDVDIAGKNDRFSSGMFSGLDSGARGKGGKIEIDTRSLSLRDGGQISASTAGYGDAGSVKVTASTAVTLVNNANISSAVDKGGLGNGGNIEIATGSLSLKDDSQLSVSTFARGKAGNIVLENKRLSLDRGSISAVSTEEGKNGSILISSSDLLLMRNNSLISTESKFTSSASGGDIKITTPFIIAFPGNNDIRANAPTTLGGGIRISINSQGLFNIKYSPQGQDSLLTNDITSTGFYEENGIVNRDDPAKANQLPEAPTDASNQIAQTCSASNRQNKFTVAGRGGLPSNANEPLTSDVVWQDTRATSSQPAANSTTNNSPKYPPPAVGLVFDGKGKAMLVAAATEGQPTGTNATCPQAREDFRIRDRETEEFRIRD